MIEVKCENATRTLLIIKNKRKFFIWHSQKINHLCLQHFGMKIMYSVLINTDTVITMYSAYKILKETIIYLMDARLHWLGCATSLAKVALIQFSKFLMFR